MAKTNAAKTNAAKANGAGAIRPQAIGPQSIGELARRTGCKVPTIRYYESVGLMPPPIRSAGNQRLYDRAAIDRLGFIRHGRELGFSLTAIRELLALADNPDRSCADADRIAKLRLVEVEGRIARLDALRRELRRMIRQCRGDRIADCRVIEVLSAYDHEQCLSDHHEAGVAAR
jgi:Cu(I)-responsive transcriptional regulator